MHTLPTLPYEYDALEPYIDAKTMEIHHTKHHQAYIDKLNAALEKYPDLGEKSAEELLKDLNAIPEDIRMAVRNHGGGHSNHSMFWQMMTPDKKEIGSELKKALEDAFGSVEEFQKKFTEAAIARFGSGWAWLTKDAAGTLEVTSTANQDSLISEGKVPLLGLDVWEHAYYISYQNKRPDYIAAWWNVVNWEEVEKRFAA
jgi:Fe-Mn family superoxide dismutase